MIYETFNEFLTAIKLLYFNTNARLLFLSKHPKIKWKPVSLVDLRSNNHRERFGKLTFRALVLRQSGLANCRLLLVFTRVWKTFAIKENMVT